MGKKKRIAGLLKIIVLGGIMILLGLLFWPNSSRLYQLISQDKQLQQKIVELEEENMKLREKIYLLENDPVFLERIARDELGLSKPNETIYKFEESSSSR